MLDRRVVVHESPCVDASKTIADAQVFDDSIGIGFLLPVAWVEVFGGFNKKRVIVGMSSFSNGCHLGLQKRHQSTGNRADVVAPPELTVV